ncbi:helix-turn-helix transcriptional regulator [Polaribacter vadi]|uniref:helix-turn-helix domain-containing protein n=1 Tax=Polaribacter vadi TaxID=1774273 RepID=UPI0030EBB432|tara:strand:- start:25094 stop:25477 length:384 start_codon:yes stop_codon:yes gene_type:complete
MTFIAIMYIINYLKQARRSASLTLQDMAYLLDMDFSNLSKYETGKKQPPARVIIAYHIITKTPLKKLFKYSLLGVIDAVSSKTTSLISQLEDEMATPKLKKRILALYEVLNNIGCLQDVSEKEHDSE